MVRGIMDWTQIIGWIWCGIVIWCVWEAWNAPLMPDEYNEQGINKDYTEIDDEVE